MKIQPEPSIINRFLGDRQRIYCFLIKTLYGKIRNGLQIGGICLKRMETIGW
jgi:hypothetical protein